jgi:hypothetical protein
MRNHILLLIDGNSNMRNSDLKNALEECSLKEAIMARHVLNGLSTFRRNYTKNTIDGIWTSTSIKKQVGRYLAYETLLPNSDH